MSFYILNYCNNLAFEILRPTVLIVKNKFFNPLVPKLNLYSGPCNSGTYKRYPSSSPDIIITEELSQYVGC